MAGLWRNHLVQIGFKQYFNIKVECNLMWITHCLFIKHIVQLRKHSQNNLHPAIKDFFFFKNLTYMLTEAKC